MTSRRYPPLFRVALIGVLALAFGLGACGRKGPLEAPPASFAPAEPVAPPADRRSELAPPGSFALAVRTD